MKNLKDFVLRENDIERNGHIYCKVCGTRVDGELLDLGFTKFIPRIKCECEIKRDKENEERERLMRISTLKRDCFSSPIQHKYNFEKYLNEKGQAYKVAYNYAKSFEQMKKDNVGLLFYGDVGSGKTYLACSIANELIERKQVKVKIMNLSQVINQIQKSAFKLDSNEIINNLSNIPLLILDDLGIERDTSYAREQVYNIINSRYLKCKPTIFTTNLSLEIIQNPNIDLEYQRIYSRILEMTIPVKVTGEDFRRKIQQEKLRKYKELLLYGGGIDD
ncbi:ATP-binding protein [Clostridioides difficile]|uniref:ATP-binding protein n=1 Tax=Clostridioides difficile TaxID=1496 RepID=UPI00255F3201|nr:ATP-binding protein [Clostridioides difficile]GMK85145.1 ATP-binding protein [Clostridioides difficile]GMK89001.1 ATP-binding protein [Clostridioides difficile]GML08290.1 ATP-binding protein [Clostridioides difficile]GML10086.1 ATP-binding protein [Clostridioides difficile]GML14921.1 ATP-binding protein [Clostridioides difficile]